MSRNCTEDMETTNKISRPVPPIMNETQQHFHLLKSECERPKAQGVTEGRECGRDLQYQLNL